MFVHINVLKIIIVSFYIEVTHYEILCFNIILTFIIFSFFLIENI